VDDTDPAVGSSVDQKLAPGRARASPAADTERHRIGSAGDIMWQDGICNHQIRSR
jgi:hypothetical protein